MRLRRWIALAAVFGMLLHAVALVRHNTAMLGAPQDTLSTDLAQICHGGGDAQLADGLPHLPAGGGPRDCPLCSGMGPVFLALSVAAVEVAWAPATAVVCRYGSQATAYARPMLRPFVRGPPVSV